MARRAGQTLSNRFLQPSDRRSDRPSDRPQTCCRPLAHGYELFAEGQWQGIRVVLERQGWSFTQVELIHDQLRQGWSLDVAKRHVADLTGFCPLRSRRDG